MEPGRVSARSAGLPAIWSPLVPRPIRSGIRGSVRTILIAAKELTLAKSRLAALAPGQRAALARAMFDDVLAAALAAASADCVAVVTSDRGLLEAAQAAGALGIDERYPRGLNAAVAMATQELMAAGVTTLCTLLSDTPGITPADIDAVLERISSGNGVILVPSRDGHGTNVILRRPPNLITTRFGTHSLALHRGLCEHSGIPYQIMPLPGPALDLDEMADLTDFARLARPGRTMEELCRLELAIP
jgi:2-phospho-L-lactate guanylyltransferase